MDEWAQDGPLRLLAIAVRDPWLQALVLVVVAFMAAELARRIIGNLAARLLTRSVLGDGEAARMLRMPVFLSVLLLGFTIALLPLPVEPTVRALAVGIFQTAAVLVWLLFALKMTALVLKRLAARPAATGLVQHSTLPLIDYTLKITLLVIGVYLLFSAWGVELTALLASAGLIGLAMSFAARDTLSNVFAGIAIIADQPYRVGDYINLDTGERGMITNIGIRSTRMLTRDDVEISIPNSIMGNAKIINESGGPHEKFRIRVNVSVAYGSDIDEVETVLMGVAAEHPDICTEPEPRVRFRVFGDSGLEFELLCWIERPVLKGRLEHEMNRGVYKAFNARGISIPFPQRDLHIRAVPESLNTRDLPAIDSPASDRTPPAPQ